MSGRKLSIVCSLVFFILAPLQIQARTIDLGNFYTTSAFDDEWILRLNVRGSADIMLYTFDLSDRIERTYAHPDDSSTGYTDTNLENAASIAFTFGGRVGIGYNRLMIYAGYDYRFNPGNEFYTEELCDYGGESYAYTIFQNGAHSQIPVWGIEYFINDFDIGFYFEVGYPTNEFRIENGHYRWDDHDKVRGDSWEGTGTRYVIGAETMPFDLEGFYFDYLLMGDIHIFYENYDIEFYDEDAEVTIWGFSLTVSVVPFIY